MKLYPALTLAITAAAASLATSAPASAASFSCMDAENMKPAEQRICASPWLGALDERLDSWYGRALQRAKYFDQTNEVRAKQRLWVQSRNACGWNTSCLRRHYLVRIQELKNYVEHV
jgi:uncharacterized protein